MKTRLTLTFEVPSTLAPDVKRMLGPKLDKLGVTNVGYKEDHISDELRQLGLSDELNIALGKSCIRTIPMLSSCNVERLELSGFKRDSLREIIRALARHDPPRTLAGSNIETSDLIEHLELPHKQYNKLKLAGLDSLSATAALDTVGLAEIVGDDISCLVRALKVAGFSPARLGKGRRLADLKRPLGVHTSLLSLAGFDLRTLLDELNEEVIAAALHEHGKCDDDTVQRYMRIIKQSLAYCGFILPNSQAAPAM
jgi:hypothetical protein